MSTDYNKCTVAQLKEALAKKGLNQIGKKQELVDRLTSSDQTEVSQDMSEDQIISEIDDLANEQAANDDVIVEQEVEENQETAEENGTNENGGTEEAAEEGNEEEKKEEGTEENKDESKEEGTTETTNEEGDKKEGESEEKTEGESGEKTEEKAEEEEEILPVGKGTILALEDDTKIVVPNKSTVRQDLDLQNKLKTVALYPVKVEDLSDPAFANYFTSSQHFNVCFMENQNQSGKTENGYIELRFATSDEAEECATLLGEQKPDITVKHFTAKDTKEDVVKKENAVSNESVMNRHLYIGNLPSSATEQNLHALFPDAVNLIIAHNEDLVPKGYAIAEMASEEAVERATMMYRNVEFEGNRLVVLATWFRPPKGLMDYRARQDVLKRVRNLKFRMKNRRGRFQNPMAIQKMDNEMKMCKQRLDKDCKVREELGLTSPPDVIYREKLQAEQKLKREEEEKEKKEKGEDTEATEGDEKEDGDDGEKKEKKSPAKTTTNKTPQRKSTGNRGGGALGRFQSARPSYSGRGGGTRGGRDQSRGQGSRGGGQWGGQQRRSFGSPEARGYGGGMGGDGYQPRGQNMQQAMSLLKNIQDMMGFSGGSGAGGQSAGYSGGYGAQSGAGGYDNYSGGYGGDQYSEGYDSYGGGYGGTGYSQGNKRRLSSETYGYGAGNKRGPGQGNNRQRQGYGGGNRW